MQCVKLLFNALAATNYIPSHKSYGHYANEAGDYNQQPLNLLGDQATNKHVYSIAHDK